MGNPQIASAANWFDRIWNRGDTTNASVSEYPFRLRVLVPGPRVTPRHSMFEYFLEMGVGLIPRILRHEPLNLDLRDGKKVYLLFVLPERHLSVHEQRMFIHRLGTHPEAGTISGVDIVTQEALLVSGAHCAMRFDLCAEDPEAGLTSEEMR